MSRRASIRRRIWCTTFCRPSRRRFTTLPVTRLPTFTQPKIGCWLISMMCLCRFSMRLLRSKTIDFTSITASIRAACCERRGRISAAMKLPKAARRSRNSLRKTLTSRRSELCNAKSKRCFSRCNSKSSTPSAKSSSFISIRYISGWARTAWRRRHGLTSAKTCRIWIWQSARCSPAFPKVRTTIRRSTISTPPRSAARSCSIRWSSTATSVEWKRRKRNARKSISRCRLLRKSRKSARISSITSRKC